MKNHYQKTMSTPFNLSRLTAEIIKSYSPLAARRKTYFINSIPEALFTDADPELLSSILGSLLTTIINSSQESCIQLSARNYNSGVVLLHIRNCNLTDNSFVEEELRGLQKLAAKMGGFVGVAGQRKHLTTFAFSFRSLQVAA